MCSKIKNNDITGFVPLDPSSTYKYIYMPLQNKAEVSFSNIQNPNVWEENNVLEK
jgi:hypothetical protein